MRNCNHARLNYLTEKETIIIDFCQQRALPQKKKNINENKLGDRMIKQ